VLKTRCGKCPSFVWVMSVHVVRWAKISGNPEHRWGMHCQLYWYYNGVVSQIRYVCHGWHSCPINIAIASAQVTAVLSRCVTSGIYNGCANIRDRHDQHKPITLTQALCDSVRSRSAWRERIAHRPAYNTQVSWDLASASTH